MFKFKNKHGERKTNKQTNKQKIKSNLKVQRTFLITETEHMLNDMVTR